MIHFKGKVILLDIEGTTSSVRYVHDIMFPYARRRMENHLAVHWDREDTRAILDQVAKDEGRADFSSWSIAEKALTHGEQLRLVVNRLDSLMDRDAKTTGLKELQGVIWREGFLSGELRGQVYEDTPVAMRMWKSAGAEIRIYSSGSVSAQKLYFAHSDAGDLLPLLSGHYDTKIGGKKESQSYVAIAKDIGCLPREILFVSDIPAELTAAREAGFEVALAVRPGNAPASDHDFPEISKLTQIEFEQSQT